MHIVILGNGISGITAARHIRKHSAHTITIVSDEADFFFSRTALMYVYMGHLRFQDTQPYESWFWEKNRLQLRRARVQRIDFPGKNLLFTDGESLQYDCLLLAVGSKSNKFGWPGQDLDGVRGLYHKQDLEAMENHAISREKRADARAVVVGGGLIGVEMTEMFHSRHVPVTFLVRETDFWNNILPPEESAMVTRHLREHQIDLRLETELQEILPTDQGKVKAVLTKQGDQIPCSYVGITVGVSPNVDFLKESGLEINKGILVNEYLETNLPDVYAIGDCAELRSPPPGRLPIEAVWYVGRIMGETVAHTVCGQRRRYEPGIWFNSAKFFDIEYQIYGDIQAKLADGQATLYWEHPGGKKSIRINYAQGSGKVLGFNLMGVRYRHEVCDRWIASGATMETVLPQLGLANFDPEFYPQHEVDLVQMYNRQTSKNLQLRKQRGLAAVLEFLKR